MRLLVRMEVPWAIERAARCGQFIAFECVVRRLIGPLRLEKKREFIHADIDLPPQYEGYAEKRMRNPDGTYRVQVWTSENRRSVREFVASGELLRDCIGDSQT